MTKLEISNRIDLHLILTSPQNFNWFSGDVFLLGCLDKENILTAQTYISKYKC